MSEIRESKDLSCAAFGECQAHKYVMSLIDETKVMAKELHRGQEEISKAIIMLTENQKELRRMSERWDYVIKELKDKDAKQDTEITRNSDFVNKAVGVIGSISLVAVVASAVTAIVSFLFKL